MELYADLYQKLCANANILMSWSIVFYIQNVFPEAAVIASGNNQLDDSNCPSDDSEDNDYDPDAEVAAEEKEEGSSSEEIDSTSLSEEDLGPLGYNNVDVLGLPSDDSEDDDYDPECPDPNKDVQNEGSASNESDFSSDSDEFCWELSKNVNVDEVTSSQLDSRMADCSQEGSKATRKNTTNTRHPPMVETDFENSCPVSKTRQQVQSDYKNLNDVRTTIEFTICAWCSMHIICTLNKPLYAGLWFVCLVVGVISLIFCG